MAVDVKTLRIGSHVQHHGKRKMVHSMGGDTVYLLPSIVSSVVHVAKTDEIELIPITPDLLKELGFKCTDKGRVQSWWLDFFCLDHLSGKDYYNFGAIHLKYLHELESLYYLACGVEL